MMYRPHYERLTEPVTVGSADQAGEYPADDEPVVVAGVELPPGRSRYFTHHVETATDIRLGWETNDTVDAAYTTWLALVRVFSQTGLWPIVGRLGYGTARPWEQQPRRGRDVVEGGLASGSVASGPELFPSSDVWWFRQGVITLVAVEHPWEAPGAGGWDLALNQPLLGADFSAVLRSWQERFGAYMLSADELVVTRPPQHPEQAVRLAEEHRLICPYDSRFHDPEERPGEYADGLIGSTRWRFWWD